MSTSCPDQTAAIGLDSPLRPSTHTRNTIKYFQIDEGGDVAICELGLTKDKLDINPYLTHILKKIKLVSPKLPSGFDDPTGKKVTIGGFPGDLDQYCEMTGTIESIVDKDTKTCQKDENNSILIYTDIDTSEGQSGAGIISNIAPNEHVLLGLHAGFLEELSMNFGAFITANLGKWISKQIAKPSKTFTGVHGFKRLVFTYEKVVIAEKLTKSTMRLLCDNGNWHILLNDEANEKMWRNSFVSRKILGISSLTITCCSGTNTNFAAFIMRKEFFGLKELAYGSNSKLKSISFQAHSELLTKLLCNVESKFRVFRGKLSPNNILSILNSGRFCTTVILDRVTICVEDELDIDKGDIPGFNPSGDILDLSNSGVKKLILRNFGSKKSGVKSNILNHIYPEKDKVKPETPTISILDAILDLIEKVCATCSLKEIIIEVPRGSSYETTIQLKNRYENQIKIRYKAEP